jgi:NACalpha-BTF3-like transcription factor
LNCSTGADLQHLSSTSVVLEGTPLMLPTAQAMSDVGKRVKSAVEQEEEELAEGAVEVVVTDILLVVQRTEVGWYEC